MPDEIIEEQEVETTETETSGDHPDPKKEEK